MCHGTSYRETGFFSSRDRRAIAELYSLRCGNELRAGVFMSSVTQFRAPPGKVPSEDEIDLRCTY